MYVICIPGETLRAEAHFQVIEANNQRSPIEDGWEVPDED